MAEKGISIVICCHNGASRLPQTLAHLAAQQVNKELPWEVIVIDNASTDRTAEVALSLWPDPFPAPLRIISEPQLGLSYARERGFSEAKYEIVSFVDDDNWVNPDWITLAAETMMLHPEVGACGGASEAVCEDTPPRWFKKYKSSYGIGPAENKAGYVQCLWGAGLTVRKSAWVNLIKKGFHFILTGRKGKMLTSCEDNELCAALQLSNWRLWYEPRMRLKHFLSKHRLEWRYLRRLYRANGASSLGLDPYFYATRNTAALLDRMKRTWKWQALSAVKRLLSCPTKLFSFLVSSTEENYDILEVEATLGRLLELLRLRRKYDENMGKIAHAKWRFAMG